MFQRSKVIGRVRLQDVGRGRPLPLYRGPYGDVHRRSFGTSSGRNFADWGESIYDLPRLKLIF